MWDFRCVRASPIDELKPKSALFSRVKPKSTTPTISLKFKKCFANEPSLSLSRVLLFIGKRIYLNKIFIGKTNKNDYFKWDREMVENLLKNVFKKISR